jgi:transcriptional regulator with XRE-family HTH domain
MPAHVTRVMRDIGRRIAEQRIARGWTQADFAEMLGIALPNLQRMEQGHRNLTVRTLVSVAHKLGCEPSALWERPRTPRPKPGRPRRVRG